MTAKPLLYAHIAALALVGPAAAAASATPPCGSCVHLAVRAAEWGEGRTDQFVLVVTADAVLGPDPLRIPSTAQTVVLEIEEGASLDQTSFAVRRALAVIRGGSRSARVGVLAHGKVIEALLDAGLGAYVDFVVSRDARDGAASAGTWKAAHPGLSVWTTLVFRSFGQLLDDSGSTATATDGALLWPPMTPTPELGGDLATFASLFPEGLVEHPGAAPTCDPTAVCRVTQFERPDTRERVIVVRRTGEGAGRAAIVLDAPRAELFAVVSHVGASPAVPDSLLMLAPLVADASGSIRLWLPVTGVSHLIARLAPIEPPLAERVSVVGARQLTIDEVIARHQAQAARQSSLIRTLVTHAQTTVTFEVPSFPAPVTVQAATELIERAGTLEVVQRDITVNGVAFSGSSYPRLPVIEPERVASPPLAITLNRSYRYRLGGRDTVGGRPAYVVGFEPEEDGRSLVKGRAWLDASTFGVLRLDVVQTNLRGPITASQQIDEFAPRQLGEETVWLLSRSDVRQIYQGAGISTPIHRLVLVRNHEINVEGLDARIAAARRDQAVLLRDTGQGLEYVDRGRATRIMTLAGGVLIDPNISRPLPFAGVNYSDFNFLGVGAQINAFFGGAYGQFALSVPSLGGSRWQLTGSGFAMLARYNDRAFRAGREQYGENLSQRPAHVSAGVLRPVGATTSARFEYVFDYVALVRGDTTSPEFVVPPDQAVHGARLSLERLQWGWRLVGWWNPARRAGWHAWGLPGTPDRELARAAFQRAGVGASRPWVLNRRLLTRVEASYTAGGGLDRFSRYAFDSFENRLHGYPSASVRYDRGGILRTTLVGQPGGRVRLDGFADIAVVRDRGFGRGLRTYPGAGAAVEAPGPVGLLLGAEWAYGFQGLKTNGQRGTQVVRLTAYKLF